MGKVRKLIPVFKPLIEEGEFSACREALELGWLGMGSYVSAFETEVQRVINAEDRFVAAVSTGTAALHIALIIAGVGPGDEVIVSALNCSADYQAINWVGADVVFCDCDDDTLELDLTKAADLVSPKTKAMIVMDYDCIMSDHDAINKFALDHEIRIIHDAAHSFGSSYKGRKIGSFSDICVFSHDPVKTVTCLDGGSIVVKSEEELKRVHELRLLGMQQPASVMYQNKRAWTFDVSSIGFRYHMLNLHAAVGLSQLSKLEVIMKSRQEASRMYNQELGKIQGVRIPNTDFTDVNPFLYYIRVDKAHRDNLRKYLFDNGIDTGIHWIPGHRFTMWENCRSSDLSVTNVVADEIISLPLHSKMEIQTVQEICGAVKTFFKEKI